MSGKKIKTILARHDETRVLAAEGGRTSRGTVTLARELAKILNDHGADYFNLNPRGQRKVRDDLQGWVVGKARVDFFNRLRITAELDTTAPMSRNIEVLLTAAQARGGNGAGAVAQHLVGAKLKLRFPSAEVHNESYTTADLQTARPGDFWVGDTAIHVTMSPSERLAERCAANVSNKLRPMVLVPGNRVEAARQLVENAGLGSKVDVQAVEQFVGANIQEMGSFSAVGISEQLAQLLTLYNERVNHAENDKSLQIEIPTNLVARPRQQESAASTPAPKTRSQSLKRRGNN
jgi:hypothetical protein